MKLDCTTDKYDRLYARWLVKPGDLIDRYEAKVGPIKGRTVMDLAGGTGVVSEQAILRGARHVELFDLNPRPTTNLADLARRLGGYFTTIRAPAENIARWPRWKYDVVFCRQALGYLDIDRVFHGVNHCLRKGGAFVFNNFQRPHWHVKNYQYNGNRFLEVGARFGKMVWHLQAGLGLGADITKFRWHTHDEVMAALSKHFATHSFTMTEKSIYYFARS